MSKQTLQGFIPAHALRIFLMTFIPLFIIVSLQLIGIHFPKHFAIPFSTSQITQNAKITPIVIK